MFVWLSDRPNAVAASRRASRGKNTNVTFIINYGLRSLEIKYTVSQKNDNDVAHYNFNAH